MAKRRKRKRRSDSGWNRRTALNWFTLAAEVLALGLLGIVLIEGTKATELLYGILALALLIVAFRALTLNRALHAQVSKHEQDTTLSQRLGRQLAENPDPSTAAFHATQLLQQELKMGRVALFTTDSNGRHTELLAEAQESKYSAAWAGQLNLDRFPLLAEPIRTGRPAFWTDTEQLHLTPDSAHLLTADLPTLAVYPLIAGDKPAGFLALGDSRPRRLRQICEEKSLEATAQTLALYIRTAGLQPDVLRPEDLIELLYEVTTHLNTDLSLEKVMSNILNQALPKVGATRGSIFLLDEEGFVTHRILARENLNAEVAQLVIREIMDKGLAAWMMEHKTGTIVEDTLDDNRWLVLPDHAGEIRSAVAVPFLRQNVVQGMLFLTHPDAGHFGKEHLNLATSIANQAAIAIQNARLYEQAENERRTLAAVLDSSADAVVVTDPQGRVLLTNPAARQTLGLENRQAILKEILYHPDLLSLLERGNQEEGTICENIDLDDGRTFSVSVAPVNDRENRTIGRVAVLHDITHLIELDKMKSRFVATVSHDLKSPLTAIRGFLDLVAVVGPLNEDQSHFVDRIRIVADNMADLISNLLDLGRIEAGLGVEFQTVNLRDILIAGKYDLAIPAQEKKILIDVEVPADLPTIHGDPFRLQQVTTNLLSNAIKYTPRGGHVWVRAEERDAEIYVCVEDTGIGIPPTDLPHIFDKFYRVQDPQVYDEDGTGLGLAIVKSILEEHEGRVWVESTVGKGSKFHFSLPIKSPNIEEG
jgi:two-component system NtrC family sensor kinase